MLQKVAPSVFLFVAIIFLKGEVTAYGNTFDYVDLYTAVDKLEYGLIIDKTFRYNKEGHAVILKNITRKFTQCENATIERKDDFETHIRNCGNRAAYYKCWEDFGADIRSYYDPTIPVPELYKANFETWCDISNETFVKLFTSLDKFEKEVAPQQMELHAFIDEKFHTGACLAEGRGDDASLTDICNRHTIFGNCREVVFKNIAAFMKQDYEFLEILTKVYKAGRATLNCS